MKSFKQYITESGDKIWHHGSPSGELKGSASGIHIGTHEAARQALTARIGHPAEGEWDGTRKYGETKLAGKTTLNARGPYNISGHNVDAPDHDYYPHEHPKGLPKFSDGSRMSHDHLPSIKQYKITGPMTNSPNSPMSDTQANARMKANVTRGSAKRGFYYKNDGEDFGSISAVVPNKDHLKEV